MLKYQYNDYCKNYLQINLRNQIITFQNFYNFDDELFLLQDSEFKFQKLRHLSLSIKMNYKYLFNFFDYNFSIFLIHLKINLKNLDSQML